MPTTVLIADDHQLVRQGLKAVLERERSGIQEWRRACGEPLWETLQTASPS
jgi:DNA-binding NarL/FixJ family response regulator